MRLPAEYLLTVFLFMDTKSNLVNIFPEKSVDHSDRLKKTHFCDVHVLKTSTVKSKIEKNDINLSNLLLAV